jgi:N-dimethylarginine dimethylaminohydrolase
MGDHSLKTKASETPLPLACPKLPEPPAPLFLMCPPEHFAISYNSNKFAESMGLRAWRENPLGVRLRAREQWNALRATLEGLGAAVLVMPAALDLPDQIFTADATQSYALRQPSGENGGSMTWRRVVVLSRFVSDFRAGEVAAQRDFIKNRLGESVEFIAVEGTLEGTGDNVYDPFRDVIWSGHGLRSLPQTHIRLAEATGIEVVALQVKSPFFHIDTTLAPLPRGHLLCYPGGLQPDALARLKRRGLEDFSLPERDFFIETTDEEALAFACNIVCVGDDIVMPRCGKRLPGLLEQRGYRVHPVDVDATILAGGGPHCLTNNLNLTRIPGGLARTEGLAQVAG